MRGLLFSHPTTSSQELETTIQVYLQKYKADQRQPQPPTHVYLRPGRTDQSQLAGLTVRPFTSMLRSDIWIGVEQP